MSAAAHVRASADTRIAARTSEPRSEREARAFGQALSDARERVAEEATTREAREHREVAREHREVAREHREVAREHREGREAREQRELAREAREDREREREDDAKRQRAARATAQEPSWWCLRTETLATPEPPVPTAMLEALGAIGLGGDAPGWLSSLGEQDGELEQGGATGRPSATVLRFGVAPAANFADPTAGQTGSAEAAANERPLGTNLASDGTQSGRLDGSAQPGAEVAGAARSQETPAETATGTASAAAEAKASDEAKASAAPSPPSGQSTQTEADAHGREASPAEASEGAEDARVVEAREGRDSQERAEGDDRSPGSFSRGGTAQGETAERGMGEPPAAGGASAQAAGSAVPTFVLPEPAPQPAPRELAPPPPAPAPALPQLPEERVQWTYVDESQARLSIDHPELGLVQVELALREGVLDVRLAAPSAHGALALQRAEREIRSMLRELGHRRARVQADGGREPRSGLGSSRAHDERGSIVSREA